MIAPVRMSYTRLRRELEPRWVSEYVVKTYPNFEARYRSPLGPIPVETQANYGLLKGLRVYRPWRPEADALVKLPRFTLVIEAKIFRYMDGLAKLPVYASLVKSTPELRPWPQDTLTQLLIPASIPWVLAAAQTQKTEVITHFVPDYIKLEWEARDRYWTKEAIARREERKAKLKEAGMT